MFFVKGRPLGSTDHRQRIIGGGDAETEGDFRQEKISYGFV